MVAAWLWSAANWRRAWRFLIALAALAGIVGGVAIATVAGARRATTAVDRMAERTGWPDVFVFTPSEVPAALRDALGDRSTRPGGNRRQGGDRGPTRVRPG